jgi:hypothetical protein
MGSYHEWVKRSANTTSTCCELAGAREDTFRQVLPYPDKEGRCRVMLDVTWEGKRQKLATGVSCMPDRITQQAKG